MKPACWICKDTGLRRGGGWHFDAPCYCAAGRVEAIRQAEAMDRLRDLIAEKREKPLLDVEKVAYCRRLYAGGKGR